MTKVALVIPSLAVGGTERAFIALASALAEEGMSVDLVVCEGRGELRPSVPRTVRLVDLGSPRVLGSVPALINYIRRERPCALLSGGDHTNAAVALARSCARLPIACVASVRNVWGPRWRPKNAAALGTREASRWTYRVVDRIVVVAEDIRHELVHLFGVDQSKITVIHNAVDAERIRDLALEPSDHPWFGASEPPVIVSVGAMTKQKNHQALLLALPEVRRHVDARVAFVGKGPERERLRAVAARTGMGAFVSFLGLRPNPYGILAEADLFVLPSSWEGCPNVLLEALALGVPVVATDCPGASAELLGYGRWGTVVPQNDVYALAAAIVHALTAARAEPARRQLLPPSPRVCDFTPSAVARRYLQVLGPAA